MQMVASIPGHQAPAGHVLTAVNIPQKHGIGQRPIAPHGIAIQQTAQGTPMVIQVSAAPSGQGKPTLVQATASVKSVVSGATLVPQSGSSESLKVPISAAPKTQGSQGKNIYKVSDIELLSNTLSSSGTVSQPGIIMGV